MTLVAFSGAVQLGLILSLLALGIFIVYRILGVPDLTVEGSFAAGASVSAVLTVSGRPFMGLVAAACMGVVAGMCTAFLQTKMRVQPILAGILTMMASFSVNLYIMNGRPNIPLLREETLFTILATRFGSIQAARFVLPLVVVLISVALLGVFFHTRLGLAVRATGDNEEMCRASSINTTFTKFVGLAIGNALAALGGGLIAQYQGFADINMGFGMVVVALASLIIGEAIFGRRTMLWNIGSVVVGAVIYRIIWAWAFSFRIDPANLRAISALIVAVAISYPAIKNMCAVYKLKRNAKKRARGRYHA
ncbi:MAG: ABC transporter permease [Defluviitaleaceae bacterium]|nr:ABC transporter permease [Defluviitaleaceae bacterium]